MTRTKGTSVKKPVIEEVEELSPKKVSDKIQSPFDIEDDDAVEETEKPEVESPFGPDEDGEIAGGDELGLDSEEIDPFGDKWEE